MGTVAARRIVLLCLAFLLCGRGPNASAQLAPPEKEIALYPGVAPGSENWTWAERAAGSPSNPTVQNVVHPVLMYYPADKAKSVGTAVIVAPGGGFQNLMMSYEGVDIAKRLNEMGVDAFVLKYRLRFTDPSARAGRGRGTTQRSGGAATQASPSDRGAAAANPQTGQDIPALAGADGQQAVRLLRAGAAEYGFKPDRIGIIGFSAGGAVVVRSAKGAPDGRPNFGAAIYAAEANGDAPPEGAPPMFIAVASDDQSVGYQRSLDMFSAWRKANIPVELHIFQTGAHGFRKKGGGADHFMDRLEEWMKVNGYLSK
jgi:acetyl esterase/lipase